MNQYKVQIEQYLREHNDEMIGKLAEFVRLESHFDEHENVKNCILWLEKQFQEAGFVTRFEGTPGEQNGVLIGVLGGDRAGAPVIFSGHIDTVHVQGSFGEYLWWLEEGKMYGPGVLDMKGGIIISLYVAKALNHIGFKERPIKVIWNSDEECDHINTDVDQLLMEESKGAICAFNMETGQMDNKLCVCRKSLYNIFVKVHGIGGHSGNFFEQGRNAVDEAVFKTAKMIPLTDLEKGSTVNTSILRGGDVQAKIPDYCEMTYDVRYEDPNEGKRLLESVKDIMETTFVPGTTTEYKIDIPKFRPFEAREDVYRLLDFVNHVAQENDIPQFRMKKMGACSDAGNIQAAGIPILDCCGVIGEFNHSVREYALVESLFERTLIWALVVLELNQF